MGQVQEITLNPPSQGVSGTLVVAAAGVGRIQITSARVGYITITPDATMYMCRGNVATIPVAGTEQVLLANNTYRVGPCTFGEYLCFTSTPGGNVSWTPGS